MLSFFNTHIKNKQTTKFHNLLFSLRGEEKKKKKKKVKRGVIKTSLNHRVLQGDLQTKSGLSNPLLVFRCHSFPNSLFAKDKRQILRLAAGRTEQGLSVCISVFLFSK